MDPHFTTKEKFSFPPKFQERQEQEKRKMFKHYDEFTKKFDRVTYK